MTIRLAFAALVIVGLAGMPFAAQAKKHHRHVRHNISIMQSDNLGTLGTPGISPAPSSSYGASGTSVGTVTAPSVGSYNWPSVGVTNAVPTWNNTNPHLPR
jgi:hypothetical protein